MLFCWGCHQSNELAREFCWACDTPLKPQERKFPAEFKPENSLEEALLVAATKPNWITEFYILLLKTPVICPGSIQPIKGFGFDIWEVNDRAVVALFTSRLRFDASVIPKKLPFSGQLVYPGRNMLSKISRELTVCVNPDSTCSFMMDPELRFFILNQGWKNVA